MKGAGFEEKLGSNLKVYGPYSHLKVYGPYSPATGLLNGGSGSLWVVGVSVVQSLRVESQERAL